jgi:hypothetical protein
MREFSQRIRRGLQTGTDPVYGPVKIGTDPVYGSVKTGKTGSEKPGLSRFMVSVYGLGFGLAIPVGPSVRLSAASLPFASASSPVRSVTHSFSCT